METLQILQIIWFFLLGVLLVGYSILDGFDLGVGVLIPFLSKNERETGALIKTIGPVWDGNEVWLLTAGGAMFAAFPEVYATVFSGFYLALMLVLFALIFRAVSVEFWSLDETRRGFWRWSFCIGSLLPSLLYGVALGNVIQGIPLTETREFAGSFFTLLRPYPLILGLLGLSSILSQGALYIAMKSSDVLQERARNTGKKTLVATLILFVLSGAAALVLIPGRTGNVAAWICAVLVVAALAFAYRSLSTGRDGQAFIASSLAFAGLWGVAGALQFPNLVMSLEDAPRNMSIYNSSSSQLTLTVMLIIALIGMPLVIGYTIFVYRAFKGKVIL